MTRSLRSPGLRAEPEDRPRRPARARTANNKSAPRKDAKPRQGGASPRGRRLGLLGTILVALIWVGIGGAGLVAWYAYDLPDIDKLQTPMRRPSLILQADDGSTVASYGDLYAGPVGFNEVPPYLVQAIVATEDRRFFEHPGIDIVGILRAAVADLRAGAIREGASTITQQLAKNLFLTPERSIRRKVQEMLLAFWLEAKFNKEQLFTIYMNRVYLGAGTYGVEAASRRYFGKSARDVSLREAAVLAGLLKAPTRYSPARDPAAAARRADQVLANMVDAGYINVADARAARAEPLITHGASLGAEARYFSDWVLDRATDFVSRAGHDLVLRSTLDPALQRIAERRLTEVLAREGPKAHASQAALVAMTPDGAVRAMVGGADYGRSQFNRATQALRQPGSAFKLFVYLAALEAGMTPDSTVADVPISIHGWRPKDFEGRYRGTVTLRTALAESLNTPAVQLAQRVGIDRVIAAARRLGITTRLPANLSLALGSGEVTLLELTSAYAALADNGNPVWPHAIVQIRDRSGKVLYHRQGSGAAPAIAPRVLAELNSMLSDVVAEGTGRAARLPGRAVAGKTGTSQYFRAAWFIGYTPELIVGVWVGNDESSPMRRVTGGGLPAHIWHAFMADALRGTPVKMTSGK
jgi:penicillin-binding protein 1A